MSKRGRNEYSFAQRRAAAINAKVNSRYPYRDYGRTYHKRGTDANLAMFGPSFKGASAEQKQLRRDSGYVGRGDYRKVLKWGSRIAGGLAGGIGGYYKGGVPGAIRGAGQGYTHRS